MRWRSSTSTSTIGVGVLGSAQELIDAHRGALAVGDAVDDEPRAEDAVAAGEYTGRGGHQRLRIHGDQAARRNFDAIFGTEELKIGRLPDGHDDGVAVETGFAVLVEGGTEAAIGIEDRLGLEHFERHRATVLADDLLRAEAGMDDDAFFFGLFNLLERGGHLLAVLEADQVHFLRAQPQGGERNVHHFAGGHRIHASLRWLEAFHAARMLAQHLARRGPGHIHGHVAAADDENLLADGEACSRDSH